MNEDRNAQISFPEKIILLGLNDKGWFGISEPRIKFGLAGALIFELARRKEIEIRQNTVKVISTAGTGDKVVETALEILKKSKKELTMTGAIQRLVYKSGLKWKTLLKELVRKEIVRREEYRFLRVFYQYKYPLVKAEVKQDLLADLYAKIMGEQEMTPEDMMLIAVMRSCRMIDKNFSLHEHFLKVRLKIREILEFKEPLPDSSQLVRDIQSAIDQSIRRSKVRLGV
jgi:golgi phosphoprotein 3